jgi:hypothetical protein
MKQSSFSDAEFAHKKKQTRRDRFLVEIEAVTPWVALVAAKVSRTRFTTASRSAVSSASI